MPPAQRGRVDKSVLDLHCVKDIIEERQELIGPAGLSGMLTKRVNGLRFISILSVKFVAKHGKAALRRFLRSFILDDVPVLD